MLQIETVYRWGFREVIKNETVVKLFCAKLGFLCWSSFAVLASSTVLPAGSPTYSCGVRLAFDSDDKGSIANYLLTLQIKNTTGRDVRGVSVIYKNPDQKIIGNSMLYCTNGQGLVPPGSYGECSRNLQKVDGAYVTSFGVDRWTDIVNSQLSQMNSIAYCDVIGFVY